LFFWFYFCFLCCSPAFSPTRCVSRCWAVSIALVIWLVTNVDFTKEGLPIIVVAVVGIVLYYLFKIFRRPAAI